MHLHQRQQALLPSKKNARCAALPIRSVGKPLINDYASNKWHRADMPALTSATVFGTYLPRLPERLPRRHVASSGRHESAISRAVSIVEIAPDQCICRLWPAIAQFMRKSASPNIGEAQTAAWSSVCCQRLPARRRLTIATRASSRRHFARSAAAIAEDAANAHRRHHRHCAASCCASWRTSKHALRWSYPALVE